MTALTFGEFTIESYEHGWQIGRRRKFKSGKRKGETYLAQQVFAPTLQSALEMVLERRLRESEAADLEGLLKELTRFKAELSSLFAFTVVEPANR